MSDAELQSFRRDLHAHPETGFDLKRTSDKIANRLKDAGLEVSQGVGGIGIVASLRRGPEETAIGLRADMDALPITEANEFAHRSTQEGKFHGCGHDGHSTMLLGAALKLAQSSALTRTVHFVFQPDEENGRGAMAMIDDGLFERFPMSAIYGLHNMPGMPVGHFATQPGPFCAFEDNFEIRIAGKGGHASMPEVGVDPIVVGAAIVGQLQTIVARSVAATEHCVVSVTGFETDGARNILASNVVLTGDCRGFDASVSQLIKARMSQITNGICAAQGATAEIDYGTSFRPLVNSPAETQTAAMAAASTGQIDASYGRVGFSEDFAEFLSHRPGAFMLMGNGTEGAHAMPLHNPGYDFNDGAIDTGVRYWEALALSG
ncbi:amidohydrolase [uncultured Roseobacter sp.]|uniref:amidohydrolase n=1 Tax=uncultured Roseobacter sp. TaxID=114847 RepID=UPI00261D9690|nr:amidohydrolase [uncultured Roseobacter sp.]